MNYGYEILKEILEIAVSVTICFPILGLKRKETGYFWGIMLTVHLLVWGGLVLMKADKMVIVPVWTLLEIGLIAAVAQGKWTKRIATAFLSYIVTAIADMIVEIVLKFVPGINQENPKIISRLVVLAVMIMFCIIQPVHKIRLVDVDRIHTAIILILGVFGFGVSAVISNILHHDFSSRGAVLINIIAMTILIAAFVLCFVTLIRMYYKKRGIEQTNSESKSIIESQQKYMQEILEDREQIRGLYHDLDKMVLTLNTLLESRRYDEALQMLGQLNQELNGNRNQLVYTYDELVDAVISQYAGIAEKQHIVFRVQVKADRKMKLQGYDFCMILSNLLANAVEAADFAPDSKIVNLYMKQNQDQWYIRVENTYCADRSNTLFSYSTQKGAQHGYGIRNIRKAVDRMGGKIRLGTEGKYVIAELFLVAE